MAINRTRSRSSDITPIPRSDLYAVTGTGDVVWVTNYGGPNGPWTSDTISDEQGPKTSVTRPCESVSVRVENAGAPVPGCTHNGYSYFSVGTFGQNFASIPERSDFSGVVDGFNRRSVRKIIDQIPVTTSLPTFIGELPDIPRTIKTILDLREISRSLPDHRNTFRGIRDQKDKLSDPVLGWNFGVVPLWNDVKNFLGAQRLVNKRIDELKATRGRITKFRHGGSVNGSSYKDPFSVISTYLGPYGVEGRWTGRSRIVFRTGGSYYHELGGLDDFSRRENALRASLGFDNLFKTAWDLTNLSFLVDYVSNVGDLLGELRLNDSFTGEIQLRDTWSWTKSTSYGVYQVRFILPDGTVTQPTSCSSGQIERFSRSVGIPTTIGPVFDYNIGARQAINIAALL